MVIITLYIVQRIPDIIGITTRGYGDAPVGAGIGLPLLHGDPAEDFTTVVFATHRPLMAGIVATDD